MGRIAGVTAEETRQRLLRAAARVFAERGYERATIADIAREAGLSSGAIYAHYRSKAELLAQAIRVRSSEAVAKVLSADPDLSMADALVTLGAALSRRDRGRDALLMEAVIAARRDPEVAATLSAQIGEHEQRFAGLLGAAQANGELDAAASPEIIARFGLMLALGSLMVRALGLPRLDEDEWQRFMTGLIRGIRPREHRS